MRPADYTDHAYFLIFFFRFLKWVSSVYTRVRPLSLYVVSYNPVSKTGLFPVVTSLERTFLIFKTDVTHEQISRTFGN